MNIPQLFIKLFVPTLLGLVFNAMLTLADGIFVGQGVGSNALAAVNIAAPIFLLGLGVSLMFATSVSVVAAVHLSRGNNKAANINATQALTVPFAIMSVVSVLIAVFAPQLCYLFGGSQTLEPLVVEYLTYISPIPALTVLVHVGGFIIRHVHQRNSCHTQHLSRLAICFSPQSRFDGCRLCHKHFRSRGSCDGRGLFGVFPKDHTPLSAQVHPHQRASHCA